MALFCARFGLKEPDDSRGCQAIRGAMRGAVSIAELRRVLTEDYELYPHYESQVLTILAELEETTAAVEPEPPASGEPAAVAVAQPARRRRSKK